MIPRYEFPFSFGYVHARVAHHAYAFTYMHFGIRFGGTTMIHDTRLLSFTLLCFFFNTFGYHIFYTAYELGFGGD